MIRSSYPKNYTDLSLLVYIKKKWTLFIRLPRSRVHYYIVLHTRREREQKNENHPSCISSFMGFGVVLGFHKKGLLTMRTNKEKSATGFLATERMVNQ